MKHEREAIELFGTETLNVSGSQVSIKNFIERFKSAFPNPTYDVLVEIDAGKMGYRHFFDKCKEQGILN